MISIFLLNANAFQSILCRGYSMKPSDTILMQKLFGLSDKVVGSYDFRGVNSFEGIF